MLSTRWVYALISCSVRPISIFLLINPGYFFVVVAPARHCPGSFFNILCRNPQLASRNVLDMYWTCRLRRDCAIAIRFVRSCPTLCPDMCHISTALQQSVCQSCCLVYLVKRSVRTSKRWGNRHWKLVYWRDVLLPFVPGSIAFEVLVEFELYHHQNWGDVA